MELNNLPDDIKKRLALTIAYKDCDYIPKHNKAGG